MTERWVIRTAFEYEIDTDGASGAFDTAKKIEDFLAGMLAGRGHRYVNSQSVMSPASDKEMDA